VDGSGHKPGKGIALEGSVGGERVYTANGREAKKQIPVYVSGSLRQDAMCFAWLGRAGGFQRARTKQE
jgi:hypothetical protein